MPVQIGAIALLFWYRRRSNKSQQRPVYEQTAIGNFGQQPPPTQDNPFAKPLPPHHQYSNSQPEESIFNTGSQPESKGSYYGHPSSPQQHSSVNGSQGLGSVVGSDIADTTPPYTAPYSAASQPPHTYGTTFISKPDAADVPHFTLQPSKPDEHDW